jgi:hypothetical protein
VASARDSGIQVVWLLGADEHVRARIGRCVTERAQEATTQTGRMGPEDPSTLAGRLLEL